jgi:hypothetical protein
MDVSIAEKLMVMDEASWQRHANPLSVYTRYTALPMLAAAVWSRVWLGWWSLLPIALAILWVWLNPRLFPIPAGTRSWASRSVLGERVWLNRKAVPIPPEHARAAMLLSIGNGLVSLVVIYGLVVLDLIATLGGILLVIIVKSWFLDRMVWLFEVMAARHPPYAAWLRPPAEAAAAVPTLNRGLPR